MDIRIHNLDVYVDGERIESPAQRVAVAVPAIVLAIVLAGFVMFILLPLLGFGLLLIAGIVLLAVFWFAAWLLSPLLLPVLMALGLFKWLSRD